MKKIITFFLICFSISAFSQSTTYLANKDCQIKWTGKKIVGEAHYGTISILKGSVLIENKSVTRGSFAIDMNSIKNTDIKNEKKNNYLITHLKNDDFFSVDNFPVSILEITSTERKKDGILTYNCILTIKGISNEISFDAKTLISEESFLASATITIDRSLWDIKYKLPIGDKGISKEIVFDVIISAEKYK